MCVVINTRMCEYYIRTFPQSSFPRTPAERTRQGELTKLHSTARETVFK